MNTGGAVERAPVVWAFLALALACGCVPEGPRTDDSAPRRSIEPPTPSVRELDAALDAPFRDDFEREGLGSNWLSLSSGWRVVEGQLCGRAAANRGVWLRRRLPATVRIAFDARADSDDGDLKVEVFGDGHSGADKASYDDATSYLLIYGGWNNSRHVLARLDEHATDRQVVNVEPSGESLRTQAVEAHRAYRFRIERGADMTLRWWVDDELIHELRDDEPLTGLDHDHFAFNDWNAPVCFDNLEVQPL